jgi:hypothetical protein
MSLDFVGTFKLELVPNRTTAVQSCPSYISAIKVLPLLFNPARMGKAQPL